MFNNKKGNYQDIPEYIKVVVIIFFITIIAYSILDNFNTNVQSNPLIDNSSKQISTNYKEGFLKTDYVIPLIYLIFLGFSVVSARFIPSNSKFMIVSLFFITLMPLIALFTENIIYGFFDNTFFSNVASNFVMTSFFLKKLALFVFIYSLSVGFALLSKSEVGQ